MRFWLKDRFFWGPMTSCFLNLKAAETMLRGAMIADIVPAFGSVNMIGGECDR